MGKSQVHVSLHEERKADWQQFADERSTTLSDVIRRAMAEYMAEGSTGSGGVSESVESDIASTRSTTENIESQLKNLSDRFGLLENEIQDRKEIRTVANEVYLHIPSHSDAQNQSDTRPLKGTVEWLADRIDETPAMVEKACEQLLQDSYNIHVNEDYDTGAEIYWKEDWQ